MINSVIFYIPSIKCFLRFVDKYKLLLQVITFGYSINNEEQNNQLLLNLNVTCMILFKFLSMIDNFCVFDRLLK